MITAKNLPDGYAPFDAVVWCSNRVSDGGHLVSAGEAIPVLVGKGKPLRVWLQTRTESAEEPYRPVVEASVSQLSSVRVESDGAKGLTVSTGESVLLHVVEKADGSAVVDQLDLRPLGLLMYGDASGLMVGNTRFVKNKVSGGASMLALGPG